MRVIINLHSRSISELCGWNAKAVHINNKNESNLKEVLDKITFDNGKSLSDIVLNGNKLNDKLNLFVNGIQMPNYPDYNTIIKDNVQIHVMDKHFYDR